MTGKNDKAGRPIDRLADEFVEDILNLSDDEVLAEFREDGGDPERHAAEMRSMFENRLLVANKARMNAAKAGVASSRRAEKGLSTPVVDIADARARLRAVIARAGSIPGLTLAARKEDELSDSDVVGMLEELAELGLLDGNQDVGKT
ncbi:MAG: hypothetical protein ACK47C_12415 [Paracoccaceae bacterium]